MQYKELSEAAQAYAFKMFQEYSVSDDHEWRVTKLDAIEAIDAFLELAQHQDFNKDGELT